MFNDLLNLRADNDHMHGRQLFYELQTNFWQDEKRLLTHKLKTYQSL